MFPNNMHLLLGYAYFGNSNNILKISVSLFDIATVIVLGCHKLCPYKGVNPKIYVIWISNPHSGPSHIYLYQYSVNNAEVTHVNNPTVT